MDDNFLKTRHIKSGIFHFLRMEILGTILLGSFFMFAFIVPEAKSENPNIPLLISMLIVFSPVLYGVIFAYFRARFIRNGGYCIITSEKIQSVYKGKIKVYDYKGRSISTRKRKENSMDIYIGKSLIDLIKFGFGRKYFKTVLAGLGFGAPLYNVTNADEVLEYIKRHN